MIKRRKKDEQGKVEELPLTPMIDVIFQLLIFFMLMPMNRTVEGLFQSQMPKDKGLSSSTVKKPELKEVRIKLRFDANSNITTFFLQDKNVGSVGITIVPKGTKGSERKEKIPAEDKAFWLDLADRVDALYSSIPSSRDPSQPAPVILEAGENVPWEHVIGTINACKGKDIHNIEFSGNPKYKELY